MRKKLLSDKHCIALAVSSFSDVQRASHLKKTVFKLHKVITQLSNSIFFFLLASEWWLKLKVKSLGLKKTPLTPNHVDVLV